MSAHGVRCSWRPWRLTARGREFLEMRQWRRKARRPSGQDLVMLLRQQFSQEQDPVTNPEPMILTAAIWLPRQS